MPSKPIKNIYVGALQSKCVLKTVDKNGLLDMREKAELYLWGVRSLGGIEQTGSDIASLIDLMLSKAPAVIYFNNLKLVAPFVYEYLLSNGYTVTHDKNVAKEKTFSTLITAKAQEVYCIRIPVKKNGKKAYVEFRCTKHKIVGSVADLAKKFHVDYTPPPHDWHRGIREDVDPNEYLEDLKAELRVLAAVVQKFYNKQLTSLTISADAVRIYKGMLGRKWRYIFPVLPPAVDDWVRMAYRGGITVYNPAFIGKDIDARIFIYDRKSAYPACTLQALPWGVPRYYRGKYTYTPAMPLYIQNIDVDCRIKPGHFPCLTQLKQSLTYLDNYVVDTDGELINLTLTCVDLELLFENYDVFDIKYNEGYKFYASTKLFAQYMLTYYAAKEATEGGEREIYKALIDAITGKIAERPRHPVKLPVLTDDGIKYKNSITDYSDPFYTACTAFICAYQRKALIDLINENRDTFIYSDVDSIHCTAPIDPKYVGKQLGDWAREYVDNPIIGGRYVGAKMYVLKHESGDLTRRLASCPDDTKNTIEYAKFIKGLRIKKDAENAKLRLTRMPGGAAYVPIDFTLK